MERTGGRQHIHPVSTYLCVHGFRLVIQDVLLQVLGVLGDVLAIQVAGEKLLENILFEAPDIEQKEILIDAVFVTEQLMNIVENQDLSRYIL